MNSKEIGKLKLKKIEKLLYERAQEEGLTLEKNIYFTNSSYLDLHDKNDPKKRIYIEAGYFHLFEGISIIQYYDGKQTTYSNHIHEIEDVVNYILHSLKHINKRPISGSTKSNKSVEEHFSKWKEVK